MRPGGEWLRAWSVSDLMVPVPPARTRRWMGALALIATAAVVALCARNTPSRDFHFTPELSPAAMTSGYALVMGLVLGAMFCRQQLLAAPTMLLVPVTGSAVVTAAIALVVDWPTFIVAMLALQLATLIVAARIWGLFTSRRDLRAWLPAALASYYAAVIAAAHPIATALQTLATNTEHGA